MTAGFNPKAGVLLKYVLCWGVLFLFNQQLKAQIIFLEAEYAVLNGVVISTAAGGNSGGGYISGFDNSGDQITFIFNAHSELYSIQIGFRTPYGTKGFDLSVNGAVSSGMFPASTTFSEHDAGKYLLLEGENTIIIGGGWNWYEIDYLKLDNSATVQRPLKPPAELINTKATASTKALHAFLIDNYGRNVLSGQQDLLEINYIHMLIGKMPAVGVFDLIDYSPSRIERGANPAGVYSVEAWIDWALNYGGIVSMSWHWNAPSDLIDTPGHEWWSGFYTHATTFDVQAALADTTSENYHLLLRDMDVIAVQLKKFSDADIPVLWRPLHEASGAWFWWGAKGAQAYQELWKLLYHRLTDYHNLHNLIWVATTDYNWYAGDDYVDIIGLDVYTDPSSSMSIDWENIQSHVNGQKLVALSESGTLPNPENIRIYGTWWSWFSIWSGAYIRDIDAPLLDSVYNDENVITADELPDWRIYTALNQKKVYIPEKISLRIYPNPFNPIANFEYSLAEAMGIKIYVYELSGKLLHSKTIDLQPAGTYTYAFQAEQLASAVYIVQIKSGQLMISRKIVLIK